MPVEIITAGKLTVTRGSIAVMNSVCAPPPLAPVTPIRLGSTSGKPTEPIERPDRVISLDAHEALQPQLGLWAQQSPTLGRVHVRPMRGLGVVLRKGVGQGYGNCWLSA